MASKIDNLVAEVARVKEVEESAVVLINGIASRIAEAGVDPVALQAVVDDLKSSSDALAAAVTANTPTPSA